MSTAPLLGYADCFSGISGDMFLGALLHCGLAEDVLQKELAKLNLGEFTLKISATAPCGIDSRKVDIVAAAGRDFRHLHSIRAILEDSDLDEQIIATSLKVFTVIAEAEAKVHATDIDKIHFHEVGAVDTIVDVVGTVAGLSHLGIGRLVASPLPSPRGFVRCAHGRLPLPAPAVCEILRDLPCYGVSQEKELVTPTGAALLKVLAQEFGELPPMQIKTTGYGAGSHDLGGGQPNLFRLILGKPIAVKEHQEVEVIECNIDDTNPEMFPFLFDRLFTGGALDVSLAPIQVKKGRPGFRLQVISPLSSAPELREIIFTETTAIGLRYRREQRQTLPREKVTVTTPWGEIAAKEVLTPRGKVIYPEYEECRKIALEKGVTLQEVYHEVWQRRRSI